MHKRGRGPKDQEGMPSRVARGCDGPRATGRQPDARTDRQTDRQTDSPRPEEEQDGLLLLLVPAASLQG